MKTIKTIQLVALITLFIGFSSCSNDDDTPTPLLDIETETFSNLHAPQAGGQGQPVSGAFRGTSIIINGGVSLGTTDEPDRTGNAAAYIASGTLASVLEVDSSLLLQDTTSGYAIPTGSGNGWYLYNPQAFLITPIAGKILVFRTRDGRYAKVEILSYYKDAPENPDVMVDESRYFTFNYVYQPNEGVTSF